MCKKYSDNDNFSLEEHPFPISIPTDAKTLIIGTFPSHVDNRIFRYYYSSRDNNFWRIMRKVFDWKFSDLIDFERTKRERENFLH